MAAFLSLSNCLSYNHLHLTVHLLLLTPGTPIRPLTFSMKYCGKCAARLDAPMSKTRILITTTSFQDTPGRHHDLLAGDAYDIERARGPLPESAILALVGDYDAILCGDDAFTRPVLQKCLPRLKVLSKYGIGVDKVDLQAATELRIPVTFCPGVNHVTVAEHTFGLLLALTRQIPQHDAIVKRGEWHRGVGRELAGKTLGLLGLGRIGREVAQRAVAFDMRVSAYTYCMSRHNFFGSKQLRV